VKVTDVSEERWAHIFKVKQFFLFEGPTFLRNAGDYLLAEDLLGLLDLEYEGTAFL